MHARHCKPKFGQDQTRRPNLGFNSPTKTGSGGRKFLADKAKRDKESQQGKWFPPCLRQKATTENATNSSNRSAE